MDAYFMTPGKWEELGTPSYHIQVCTVKHTHVVGLTGIVVVMGEFAKQSET